jgi:hypothetical protein
MKSNKRRSKTTKYPMVRNSKLMSKESKCQYQIKTIFYNLNSQIEATWSMKKLKMNQMKWRKQGKLKKSRANT